jgi:hypothetical protein
MTEENQNRSESASELQEIKEMVTQLQAGVGYLTALMETIVERMSLADKGKSKAQDLMDMNVTLMASLFKDKNFDGKDQVMDMMSKIQNLGTGSE